MCRIFDKATVWADRCCRDESAATLPVDVSGFAISETGSGRRPVPGRIRRHLLPARSISRWWRRRRSRPRQVRAIGDPLWSQTADELRGVPQEMPRTAAPEYDAQKVENLKAALDRDASSRGESADPRAEDAITVVLISRESGSRSVGDASSAERSQYGDSLLAATDRRSAGVRRMLPAVLILRTTKADVDAVAKGGLSQEQFAGKVQVLKSWTIRPRESRHGRFGGGTIGGTS